MKAYLISKAVQLALWLLKKLAQEVIPDICPIAKNGGCMVQTLQKERGENAQ